MTNGKRSFVVGDGNSPWARRQRDLVELYARDLGHPDALSEAQMGLARRAATMACELERMEGELSLGKDVDLDLYSRIAGHLRRIHETLGIQRSAAIKEINPLVDHFSRPPARATA